MAASDADRPEVEQYPAGYLVYAVTEVGTTHIVGYAGPDALDEARAMAKRLRGVVIAAPVLADYS